LLVLVASLSLSLDRAKADAAEPSAAGGKIVIGLSLPMMYSSIFDAGLRGAQRAADALGVELVVVNGGWNAQKQAKDIDDLVSRQVDGIVVWSLPVHMGSLVPNVEAAVSAGIPVAIANTPLDTDKALVQVTEDQADAGRQVAKLIIERLHGHGSIIEIEGPPGFAAGRKRALEEVLSSSDIKILASQDGWIRRARAKYVMAALIKRYPKFDGVVALNDEMMIGVIDAMREAGIRPSRKLMVSLDYIPEANRLIQTGDLTATFDPRFDQHTSRALELLVEYIRNKATPSEKVVLIKGALGILACAPEVTTLRARSIDSRSFCRSDWTAQRRYTFIAICAGAPPVALEKAEEIQDWCMCYQAEVERRHSWAWVTDGEVVAAEDDEAEDQAAQGACSRK
jgi:ribose transport system substrate-binding protein